MRSVNNSESARIKSLVLLAPSARLAAALESAFRKNAKLTIHTRDRYFPISNNHAGVLTGAVGGNFGPFPRSSTFSTSRPPAFSHRDSLASSSIGLDPVSLPYGGASANAGADSPRMTEDEYGSQEYVATSPQMQPSNSRYSVSRLEGIAGGGAGAALLWEKEPDDFLHECVVLNRTPGVRMSSANLDPRYMNRSPDPALDKAMDKQMHKIGIMALINTAALMIVVIVLVGLFAGWPIYRSVLKRVFAPDNAPERC